MQAGETIQIPDFPELKPKSVQPNGRIIFAPVEGSAYALHGDKMVSIAQHEQPWYRLAAHLSAAGYTPTEIAERVERAPTWVAQVLRHPFVRKIILEEIQRSGRDEMQALLKGEVAPTVFKMIELRDDPNTPKAVALGACNAILERVYGKPAQKVEMETKNTNFDGDLAKIDADLERLTAEEKRLLGKN
jgi:hypothetical protein